MDGINPGLGTAKAVSGNVTGLPARRPRLRRFDTIKPGGRAVTLAADHPAVIEGRPLFPARVVPVSEVKNILVSGANGRKIGRKVMKGPRYGWPIYMLTLPERSTCPPTCQAYAACYGNGMNWAKRIKPDAAFEAALWTAIETLQAKHPAGFLVRLHILGDFYSEGYVDLINRALDAFPAFHAFGFTARDPDTDPIGSALWAITEVRWDRFTIRFSGKPGGYRASRVIDLHAKDPEAVTCPAQNGQTDCCATCGLCFHPSHDGSIAFWKH